jgi:RNA polymerase sigma-70 factor (ECF subfamily)
LIREQGFRNKDVAEILGISVNTIDVQLAIAIKRISKAINLDVSNTRGFKKIK